MADDEIQVGDTCRADLGVEVLEIVNKEIARVRWHNGGLVGQVPLSALTKIFAGPQRSGFPRLSPGPGMPPLMTVTLDELPKTDAR